MFESRIDVVILQTLSVMQLLFGLKPLLRGRVENPRWRRKLVVKQDYILAVSVLEHIATP